MSKRVENSPSPDVLMTSMRSIGYSFKTALADIVDNSISACAKNVYITLPISDDGIYISILDDGFGMANLDLLNAMKYGSDRDEYTSQDLGRFGLGLKSASLSQCRILTVASKINKEISAYQWNLDEVLKYKKWECLQLNQKEIDDIPSIQDLKNQDEGTLVVWQNFDIAIKKSNGMVREYLVDEMDDAEQHLALVFHRFLNNKMKPFNIFINNRKIDGLDPFLEENPKTDSRKPSEINIDGSIVKVQTFILPHQTDLTNDDIKKLGGIEALRSGQGFYIYRNDRLIIYGTWFKLSSNSVRSELYKYGRIKVDIPNTLDDTWDIDIKKQNATIPKQILNHLKKMVNTANEKSSEKTAKRTKLTFDKDDTKIWNKLADRDNKDLYYINHDSEYVKSFIDEFEDKDKAKLYNFLDIISATIPFDDMYNSICNKRNSAKPKNEITDSIVLEGLAQFKRIKQITQKDDKATFEKLCAFEPFNDEEISRLIWERINEQKK